jgi:hypothetical protein
MELPVHNKLFPGEFNTEPKPKGFQLNKREKQGSAFQCEMACETNVFSSTVSSLDLPTRLTLPNTQSIGS